MKYLKILLIIVIIAWFTQAIITHLAPSWSIKVENTKQNYKMGDIVKITFTNRNYSIFPKIGYWACLNFSGLGIYNTTIKEPQEIYSSKYEQMAWCSSPQFYFYYPFEMLGTKNIPLRLLDKNMDCDDGNSWTRHYHAVSDYCRSGIRVATWVNLLHISSAWTKQNIEISVSN